jgi:hypothetical protein
MNLTFFPYFKQVNTRGKPTDIHVDWGVECHKKLITWVLLLLKVTMFFLDEKRCFLCDGVTKYPRTCALSIYGTLAKIFFIKIAHAPVT